MGTDLLTRPDGQSFLLDLLTYAGWRLWVTDDEQVRTRAARGDVELVVTAATQPAAAGTVVARAMRSGGGHDPREGE
jgi:hypothetical protein